VRRLTALPDGPKGRFRCVFLPPFPRESLFRTFSFPYREHVAFHDRLMVTLRDTKEMRVTSPSGTDVSFRVRPFAAHSFSVRHEGGFMLGLPVEVTTAPLEDSVEGRIVFDVSVHLGLTSEDVTLDVAGGLVRAMRRAGRPAGSRALPDLTLDLFLREVEERAREWPDALRVGEFGLGTSASARFSGCSMEDEAVSGSCHFALGANSDFGGNLRGPYHGGGEIARPTVSVDGRTILRDGLYLHRSLA
jgi:leucyl aminopeptidase (aminopeptidase T)